MLAVRELKANSTTVTAGLIAVAIAAFSLVGYRAVISGYSETFGPEIRALAGGEILIFSGIDVLVPGSGPQMEWRPWEGRPWQSYLEYYLPDLPSSGCLAFPDTPKWSPLNVAEVVRKLQGVPGVISVIPYYALPCRVETPRGEFEAILRARDPELETGIYSMAGYISRGRLWNEDEYEAIVPVSSDTALAGVRAGDSFQVYLPGPGELPEGVDWTTPTGFVLSSTGEYDMSRKLQAVATPPDARRLPSGGEITAPEAAPAFKWGRPEIMVVQEVFQSMCRQAGWSEPLCYQVAVRVDKMSRLKAIAEAATGALGRGYAVLTLPELGEMRVARSPLPVALSDTKFAMLLLTYLLSGTIVCGTVYIMISQSRRKIGLLRVIGATSRQIAAYVYSLMVWVFMVGSLFGFVPAECLRFIDWLGSGVPISMFMRGVFTDAAVVFGAAVTISVIMGSFVVAFASRLSCAEVLARG